MMLVIYHWGTFKCTHESTTRLQNPESDCKLECGRNKKIEREREIEGE